MRTFIQKRLSELENVDCGALIPDSIVQDGQTYFGYTLYISSMNADFDRNATKKIILTGFLVRKESAEENTMAIIDEAACAVCAKLKEMNMLTDEKDIDLTDGLRKKQITATAYFNEINNVIV